MSVGGLSKGRLGRLRDVMAGHVEVSVNTCATLTPTLSLAEGEGVVSIPSPPEGERDRVRGRIGRGARVRE
jgi:hypothetical protein